MPYTGGNLYTCFTSRCRDWKATFVETVNGRRISYAETFEFAGQLSNALREVYGVKPGDRVAVQVDKSASALVLYLACLRSGAIYLPLNTAYTPAELDYFVGDAEPKLVVCDPSRARVARAIAAKLAGCQVATLSAEDCGTLLEAASRMPPNFVDHPALADDLAAILYTSGTTGRSKGAMLTHGNLGSNAAALVLAWDFSPQDVLLHALPIFHTHGLFVATNVTMMSAASMILIPKFNPDLVQANIGRATVMMGVPTFYTRLLQEPWLGREATATIRLFISGSAPLLAETHREWAKLTGHDILERYGMTETNMITSNPLHGGRGAEGKIGMIQVRGPDVFKGYWRMPEKTAAEFDEGYFVTGDLGRLDADGYLSIVGRGKDLVITGGYNVYPKEVESEIDQIDGVIESAVIGVAHPDFGEGVTAIIVTKPEADLTEGAILKALQDRLAKFKMPKRVIFVDELPRNTMGKITKDTLKERHADLYRAS